MKELDECVMPFGKHKGKLLKDMWENDDQLEYLQWLSDKNPDNITNVAIKLWIKYKGESNE